MLVSPLIKKLFIINLIFYQKHSKLIVYDIKLMDVTLKPIKEIEN